jgi:hypothetical protein
MALSTASSSLSPGTLALVRKVSTEGNAAESILLFMRADPSL